MSRKETSYGVIPLKKGVELQVLLVRHKQGHWAFPKGHPNEDETPLETGARELKEETNLDIVSFLPLPPLQEHYFFTFEKERIDKTVLYFLAFVEGEVEIQKEEIIDHKWVPLERAKELATFKATKEVIAQMSLYNLLDA